MLYPEFPKDRRGDRCTELWAYVTIDPKDDCEGVIALRTHLGAMPAVGADKERMLSMRDLMVQEALRRNITIRLVRFSVREDVEVLNANP